MIRNQDKVIISLHNEWKSEMHQWSQTYSMCKSFKITLDKIYFYSGTSGTGDSYSYDNEMATEGKVLSNFITYMQDTPISLNTIYNIDTLEANGEFYSWEDEDDPTIYDYSLQLNVIFTDDPSFENEKAIVSVSKLVDLADVIRNKYNYVGGLTIDGMKLTIENTVPETPPLEVPAGTMLSFQNSVTSSNALANFVWKLDCSLLTDFTTMFMQCTGLTYLWDIDTSSGVYFGRYSDNYNGMFAGATDLEYIPYMHMENAYQIGGMFRYKSSSSATPVYCTNLNDSGLQNIMASLMTIGDGYDGPKTLNHVGLSSTQATRCTQLSNWSGMQRLGWSTGY